jgi:hypothetical protein
MVMIDSEVLSGVCLEGIKKSTKDLIHDNRDLCRDSKQEPPECKFKVLPLCQPARFLLSSYTKRFEIVMVLFEYLSEGKEGEWGTGLGL